MPEWNGIRERGKRSGREGVIKAYRAVDGKYVLLIGVMYRHNGAFTRSYSYSAQEGGATLEHQAHNV